MIKWERKKKPYVLYAISQLHPLATVHFVEDRLATLMVKTVQERDDLANVVNSISPIGVTTLLSTKSVSFPSTFAPSLFSLTHTQFQRLLLRASVFCRSSPSEGPGLDCVFGCEVNSSLLNSYRKKILRFASCQIFTGPLQALRSSSSTTQQSLSSRCQ